jgi:hypothetical protein
MNAATKGDQAATASHWPDAIEHYTLALIELPRAPTYYIKRSTAYSRLKPADGGPDSEAALRDAETALVLARERGKRELILDAQMRRAIALFQLERYGDAAFLFNVVKDKLGIPESPRQKSDELQAAMAQGSSASGANSRPKNSHEQELSIWLIKVRGKLSKLEKGTEKEAVTVQEYPEIKVPEEQELRKILSSQLFGASKSEATKHDDVSKDKNIPTEKLTTNKVIFPAQTTSVPAASGSRVRHEWYQSNDSVILTLYVKGVQKDKVNVEFYDTSVCVIEIRLPPSHELRY